MTVRADERKKASLIVYRARRAPDGRIGIEETIIVQLELVLAAGGSDFEV